MRRNRRELGEGQFGCLVGLVFLLAAGLIAYKMIPVKVKAAELRDTVTDEAKSAGRHSDAIIRKQILAKAEQLRIPLKESDIKIERQANNTLIIVEVNYTVPVEFPGFVYQWDFRVKTENPIF